MVNHLSWYQEATEDINQLSTNVLTGGFLMFSGGIEVEHWLKMVKQKFPEKKEHLQICSKVLVLAGQMLLKKLKATSTEKQIKYLG